MDLKDKECENVHCVDGFIEVPYGHIYGNPRCPMCVEREDNDEQE